MPSGSRDRAAVVDLDVLPPCRRLGHCPVRLRVCLTHVLERLVGEDHAEAEGVLDPIPLEDRHAVTRVVALQENGEIEARRPGANDRDVHVTGHRLVHLVESFGGVMEDMPILTRPLPTLG